MRPLGIPTMKDRAMQTLHLRQAPDRLHIELPAALGDVPYVRDVHESLTEQKMTVATMQIALKNVSR
jgi:hypothetical protein